MADGRIVFNGANLFDGENAPRGDASVVVEGRRITAIGNGQAPEARPGDRVIDLAGKTLMPGMYSSHFHSGFGLFGSGISAPILGLEQPAPYYGIIAAKNAGTALHCGFTSIIGSSNGDTLDVCLKDAIQSGYIEGPRVTPCTPEMMTTGDQADGNGRSWFMDIHNSGLIRTVDGADDWRHAVREEVSRGAEIVKISTGPGHGGEAIRDFSYMTRAEVDAIVETAHSRGALVRSHCTSRTAILQAAHAGIDIIDHCDRPDDECIEAILEADVAVLPSMLFSLRFLELAENWNYANGPFPMGGGGAADPDDTQANLRGIRADFDYTCEMVPKMVKAGVRLLVGDDFGTPLMPHGDYISEFEFYVKQLGIPAVEVLKWATANGADTLGKGDRLGRIGEGKLADLLVIDGDPTTDITCLRDPANMPIIMKDGELVRDALAG